MIHSRTIVLALGLLVYGHFPSSTGDPETERRLADLGARIQSLDTRLEAMRKTLNESSGNIALIANGNYSSTVKNQMSETVGRDRNVTVGAEQRTNIGSSYTLVTGASHSLTIGGSLSSSVNGSSSVGIGGESSISVRGNSIESYDKNLSMDVDGHFTAQVAKVVSIGGKSIDIRGEDAITIRCGSASIQLKKNGDVTIEGSLITIKGSSDVLLKGSKIKQN